MRRRRRASSAAEVSSMPKPLTAFALAVAATIAASGPGAAVQAPAATCRDPVVGVWRGTWYDPSAGDWHIFRVTIGRVPGQPMRLDGHIEVEAWDGSLEDRAPPTTCDDDRVHYEVRMPAAGTQLGARVTFAGRDPEVTRTHCRAGSYNPDTLTGQPIDGRLELRAQDGHRDMGIIRFARERCTPPAR